MSPKTEVEKWRIEILEVVLNVFAGFVNFGKVRKTEETLANFSEKKKFTTSLPHYFLKIC